MDNAYYFPPCFLGEPFNIGGDVLLRTRWDLVPELERDMGPLVAVPVDGWVMFGNMTTGPLQGSSELLNPVGY